MQTRSHFEQDYAGKECVTKLDTNVFVVFVSETFLSMSLCHSVHINVCKVNLFLKLGHQK